MDRNGLILAAAAIRKLRVRKHTNVGVAASQRKSSAMNMEAKMNLALTHIENRPATAEHRLRVLVGGVGLSFVMLASLAGALIGGHLG